MAGQVVESVVQYEGKNARELFFAPVIALPSISGSGIKIVEDIQSRLYLYYSSKLDKITKKRDGCGNTLTGNGVDITRRPIDVTDMEAFLQQCADEFNQTIYETAKKKGVDINDLTDTEIEAILIQIVTDAVARDFARQIWFNDTTLVGNADYNAYNGLFYNITAAVAASTVVNTPISAMATGTDAYNTLLAVYNAQPLAMKSQPTASKRLLVSRNIYDLYVTYLSTINGSEASYTNVVNGVPTPTFLGVPVMAMDVWDEYFLADFPADFNNGRVVMHVIEQGLAVGIDATGDETRVQSWYSIDDDIQKFRVRYKIGTTLHYHEMLSVAGFETVAP